MKRFGIAVTFLVILGGCDRPVDISRSADALLADSSRYVAHIGGASESDSKSTLSHVTAARMTDDGRSFVVLEGFAPFVKVFTRDGALRAVFMKSGSGPGEMRHPTALAVSGDSAILVTDARGRAAVYDLDGRLQEEVPGLGFPVLAAAPACGRDWIVYGPRFRGTRTSGWAQWVHRVQFQGGGTIRVASAFHDTLAAPRLPLGVAYGAVQTRPSAALIRHTLGPSPGVLEWPCAGQAPRLLRDPDAAQASEASSREPGGVVLEAGPGMRAVGGMAAVTGGYAVADLVLGHGAMNDRTEITLVRGGRRSRIAVRGSYNLWDGRPGVGVLVGTNDPFPRIFLLRESDFLSLF